MANRQSRWPAGSKPPPPGARGGRFMPKELWAERISEQIGHRRDPEIQRWLGEEKTYGPPVARMRHKMREQRLEPGQVAVEASDLRAGRYVYGGERFDRLVRPRTGPGKGWFVQSSNPQYLDSLPQAQVESRLAEYRRLVETMRRVEGDAV
jgi:hypothetical protein